MKEFGKVVKVKGLIITGGYKYVAEMEDGSEIVVREKTTRQYTTAIRWDAWAATGKTGLARFFSYTAGDPEKAKCFSGQAHKIGVYSVQW